MVRDINKMFKDFNRERFHYDKEVVNKEAYLLVLKAKIKKYTNDYYATTDSLIKDKLVDELNILYSILYYINNKDKEHRTHNLDEDIDNLPPVFVVDQSPELFELDYSLLDNIDVNDGLTEEQALELLKWTVNNTRNNLNISNRSANAGEVYDNSTLTGTCGLSQFSSLYPLQKMGFEITINNIRLFEEGKLHHAYGTVKIPIIKNGHKIEKQYLIDCTYRQFFTLPFNVIERYIYSRPHPGFFVTQSSEEIEFAKELLKNGFVECNDDNLKKYFLPFLASFYDKANLSEISAKYDNLNIEYLINNCQEEFDYTEEQFIDDGMNLDLDRESRSL